MGIVIILALCFSLFTTGCGENEHEGKTVVVFWHAMGGTLGDVLNDMIEDFNEQNPEIFIKSEFMGNYGTLAQKLMASSMVNGTPTMSQAYENWTHNFIEGEILTPLEYFIEKHNVNIKDFYEPMILSNTFDNVIYSYPFNKSMPVMYVNLDMLKEVGIEKIPETHVELMEAYKKLSTKYKGTAFSAKDAWNFFCLILQNGGKLTNPEETEAYFDSEAGVKSLNFLMDVIKNDYGFLTQGYDHQTEFAAKKVGLIVSSSVSKAYMNDITFNWTAAPLPSAKKKASIISGTNVVIFNNNPRNCSEEQQEAAWKFIDWFTQPEQTAHWSIKTNYMPVRKSALETEIMINHLKTDEFLKAALDQLPYADYEPKSGRWYQSRQEIGDILEKAFIEKKDASVYIKEIHNMVNKALKGE